MLLTYLILFALYGISLFTVNQVKNTINHQGTLDSTSYSSEEEETEDFEGK